jgi:hypothetical protein
MRCGQGEYAGGGEPSGLFLLYGRLVFASVEHLVCVLVMPLSRPSTSAASASIAVAPEAPPLYRLAGKQQGELDARGAVTARLEVATGDAEDLHGAQVCRKMTSQARPAQLDGSGGGRALVWQCRTVAVGAASRLLCRRRGRLPQVASIPLVGCANQLENVSPTGHTPHAAMLWSTWQTSAASPRRGG